MASDATSESRDSSATAVRNAPPRLWPGVVIVAGYWSLVIYLMNSDNVISTSFMTTAAACLLMTVGFLIWWLGFSRVTWRERLLALGAALAGGVFAVLVSLQTLSAMGAIFFGVPLMFTLWILWLLVSRWTSESTRLVGLLAVIVMAWGYISILRVDGIDGAMMPKAHLRWTPTDEEVYLAEKSTEKKPAAPVANAEPLALSAGDWPGFRGPGFLGEQEHAPIATNWNEAPPKQLWKRRVGPAWSSFVVIGDRIFTQEQRGPDEATVCLDGATGHELWAHVDHARFWDGQAGAGPRATPTFHNGQLLTYGATGILDCLDAATGKLLWTRDVAKDCAAPLPMWGFSSSPLIVGDLVVVFAGGPDNKGMAAYKLASGEPAWTAATGPISYSSAQLVTFAGTPQVLLLSDTGVVAVEPETGKPLWNYASSGNGIWRVVQPRQVGDDVLVGSEDIGFTRLAVAREGESWKASEQWKSRGMRPAYNDYVIVDDVAYGFDKAMFCAVDLKTGKRLWKGGRYGYGQVVLLRPQNLLIVLTEQGEVAALSAQPQKWEELGRFQAIQGKTWNHPVVAHNRLYVRNDTVMAAFELEPPK